MVLVQLRMQKLHLFIIRVSNISEDALRKILLIDSCSTERRLTTNMSVRIYSPIPTTRKTPTTSRSRVSRQPLPKGDEYLDVNVEEDADLDDEDAEEDSALYCFCQKQSYGDVRETPLSSRNVNNSNITCR